MKDKEGSQRPVVRSRGDGGCLPWMWEGELDRDVEKWLEMSDSYKSPAGVVINLMLTEETQGWPLTSGREDDTGEEENFPLPL